MAAGVSAGAGAAGSRFHFQRGDLPVGRKARVRVQPTSKNFLLARLLEAALSIRPSCSSRGAFRDRHERWVRDAMDAAVSQDERHDADGEVVWFWRPDAGVKFLRS
jgi:hypothetical protein